MRISQQQWKPRSLSPYNNNKVHNRSTNNLSVHSEHLWNMMEDIDLFPQQIYQLLKYQERNLSTFKKGIQRQKNKVAHEIQNLKKQIIHNIDDLKYTIDAELDSIYRHYMEKYATLKGQIMQTKRLKDQLQIDLDRRSNFIPKYKGTNEASYSSINNTNIMKSMQKNHQQIKKSQMVKYISQLQRQKIIPLGDLSKQIIILTQYENGFYQNKQFQQITGAMLNQLKQNLRGMYDRKYQFIRKPQQIYSIQQRPILDGIYEEQPVSHQPQYVNSYPTQHINYPAQSYQTPYYTLNPNPQNIKKVPLSRLQEPIKPSGTVAFPESQSLLTQFCQNLDLSVAGNLKSQGNDIILCSIQVNKNIIAVGGKDGSILVYDVTNGQKLANLRGHKASICKLAIISNNGKKYLASGSDCGCSSIVLWDVQTWNMKTRIQCHTAAVTAIVDLMDNRGIVSGSYDKAINIYNINNEGQLLFNLPTNKSQITAIVLNCTGSRLVSCTLNNQLSLYSVSRGTRYVQTMFLQRQILNNTMICSLVASQNDPDLLFLGSKDGKIKLINMERAQAYRTHNVCNNAIIQMTIVERKSKNQFPIVLCWPCKQQNIKIVNTETGRTTNFSTKGYIEFGCGIGPKAFFINGGRQLSVLSQAIDRREISIYNLDLS